MRSLYLKEWYKKQQTTSLTTWGIDWDRDGACTKASTMLRQTDVLEITDLEGSN